MVDRVNTKRTTFRQAFTLSVGRSIYVSLHILGALLLRWHQIRARITCRNMSATPSIHVHRSDQDASSWLGENVFWVLCHQLQTGLLERKEGWSLGRSIRNGLPGDLFSKLSNASMKELTAIGKARWRCDVKSSLHSFVEDVTYYILLAHSLSLWLLQVPTQSGEDISSSVCGQRIVSVWWTDTACR